MKMEMSIEEKDSLLTGIISEHFHTYKTNPFYVPIEHLTAKDFDLPDTRNTLLRLKEKGFLNKYKYCWGTFEIKEDGKKEFIVARENTQTDEDIEVYEILINKSKLPVPETSQSVTNEVSVFFDKKACRISHGNKFHKFQKAKGRGEMFALLWEARRIEKKGIVGREGAFKPIWELAIAGKFVKNSEEYDDKPVTTDRSVRDAVQDFRDAIKKIGAPIEILAQNGFMLVIRS